MEDKQCPVEDLKRFAECCRHPFLEDDELGYRITSDDKNDKIWCAVYFWFEHHELTGQETLREIVARVINDVSLLNLNDEEGKFLWNCVSARFEAFKERMKNL